MYRAKGLGVSESVRQKERKVLSFESYQDCVERSISTEKQKRRFNTANYTFDRDSLKAYVENLPDTHVWNATEIGVLFNATSPGGKSPTEFNVNQIIEAFLHSEDVCINRCSEANKGRKRAPLDQINLRRKKLKLGYGVSFPTDVTTSGLHQQIKQAVWAEQIHP